jgi:GNAT superfamily N-acetyltransferase
MSDRFIYTTPLDPLARPLIDELSYEYESRYGDFYRQEGGQREMEKYPPELFSPDQGGNFVLLLRGGQAVGGGAFKRHSDVHTAELKRVWTHSAYRRQGLAAQVLQELEAQALRQGYARLYLTTGFRQPEAVGLYLDHGYTALFDTSLPHETYRHLPFEKWLRAVEGRPSTQTEADASWRHAPDNAAQLARAA